MLRVCELFTSRNGAPAVVVPLKRSGQALPAGQLERENHEAVRTLTSRSDIHRKASEFGGELLIRSMCSSRNVQQYYTHEWCADSGSELGHDARLLAAGPGRAKCSALKKRWKRGFSRACSLKSVFFVVPPQIPYLFYTYERVFLEPVRTLGITLNASHLLKSLYMYMYLDPCGMVPVFGYLVDLWHIYKRRHFYGT